jgi:hypothetical protein
MWKSPEMDFTHSIALLERSNDVIQRKFPWHIVKATYGNGQLWPDTQRLLDRTFGRTKKSQTQAAWRSKHEMTPSSTHVH